MGAADVFVWIDLRRKTKLVNYIQCQLCGGFRSQTNKTVCCQDLCHQPTGNVTDISPIYGDTRRLAVENYYQMCDSANQLESSDWVSDLPIVVALILMILLVIRFLSSRKRSDQTRIRRRRTSAMPYQHDLA